MEIKELIEDILKEQEWALMTIRDQLKFGLPEETAIKMRERRVKGVLITSVRKLKEVEKLLDK